MLLDNNLTVNEAHEYLALNGVKITQVWLRTLIMTGKLKSHKVFNSRVIQRSHLAKFVKARKK